MTLPELILSLFRGRRDYVAAGMGDAFGPEHMPAGMTPSLLESKHLSGERCYGFYLLDADSRCYCSCVDFDSKPEKPDPRWKEKVEELYVVLCQCGLSPLIELSQSGCGAHVWLFFAEAAAAWLPRAWWRGLSHKLATDYPEVYPRQDELTGKGLGNLVRYPLWNRSWFVDVEDEWKPIDPAAALAAVRPVPPEDLGLLAFQLGLGDLRPDPKPAVSVIASDGIAELLPLRVQKLAERGGTLLHRRWNGDMTGMKDASRSALAMSISVELVRLYVPTPEITAAVRYWCRHNGASDKGDRDDWVNLTVAKAYDFIVQRTEQKSLEATTFKGACHAYLDMVENRCEKPLGCGVTEVDASIEGISPGEVCVIAARPGHGKTAFACQWLESAAKQGIATLLISEEMSAAEIGKRRILSITDVPATQWVPASVPHMRNEVDGHYEYASPLYLVENCNTIDRAEEIIDQFCSIHGVGLVAIDYLQLLSGRTSDRYELVTEMSRRIKQAARRNNVRMLMLSQLNREVEKRPDNEPKMSDLRESGGIEQDADLILFLQWPHRFDAEAPKDLYRIYAAKRRNGPIHNPRIETTFDPNRQYFGTEIDPNECPI